MSKPKTKKQIREQILETISSLTAYSQTDWDEAKKTLEPMADELIKILDAKVEEFAEKVKIEYGNGKPKSETEYPFSTDPYVSYLNGISEGYNQAVDDQQAKITKALEEV